MSRLNTLEYAADFIRGWPHGAAVEMNYPSDADLGNGDIVAITADGKVAAATGNETHAAVIARGKKDTFAAGGTGTGNLYKHTIPNIAILGNYVVRTSNIETASGAGVEAVVAGQPVGISTNGKWAALDATTTNAIGHCLELTPGVTLPDGTTGSVAVIHVK